MAASETEIDLNDDGDQEPLETETEDPPVSPEIPEEITEIPEDEEIDIEENGTDSPDLGPSRQLHRQRIPSRGQTISETIHPDETSDNGKTKFRSKICGLQLRAVSNQERVIMEPLWYAIFS